MPSYSDLSTCKKWMQCPQVSNEKTEVLPLWQITFDPLKNRLKNIHQWSKTCIFFHQKSEGIAFTFCRYLNQNMRAFKFCRYCLQKYFLIPSNFDEKKYHCILRAILWEFWDEVFSLKIWGHFIQQCIGISSNWSISCNNER